MPSWRARRETAASTDAWDLEAEGAPDVQSTSERTHHDAIACAVIYLVGGDPAHDELAFQHLTAFSERIAGRKGWKSAHTRLFWANAHVLARLGEVQEASRQMDLAFRRILDDGLLREALGATLDCTQLRCRPSALRHDSLRAARRAIDRCLEKRRDLEELQRRRLKEMQQERGVARVNDSGGGSGREGPEVRRRCCAPLVYPCPSAQPRTQG
jgi:hypothetical protein